jgi:inner membrane protein involved in colicin E2 resistance
MVQRMLAIAVIFVLVSVAWVVLGGSVLQRTHNTDSSLSQEVSALWGSPQTQISPQVVFAWEEETEEKQNIEDEATKQTRVVTTRRKVGKAEPVILDQSKLEVDLQMHHRKKGLLWYATYTVDFRGHYAYVHEDEKEGTLLLTYRFPSTQALYSDFHFEVDGKEDPKIVPVDDEGSKVVRQAIHVTKGKVVPFTISYRSQGLDVWRYSFGENVNRVKNFELAMTTDFKDIDFPGGTISPQARSETPGGWRLEWRSANLISGFQIGMEMPRKLNPGPLAAKISFFAPVSLFFFFVWMFVISLLRRIDLHPMNYLFLAAAFFAFHLLFAYTVDHIDLVVAFVLASLTSVFLVVSYLRLVVGLRFAALEAAGSQLVYLVLFSYAHFFEGFTGLIVTIGSILTLFLLMQVTGRIRWSDRFKMGGAPAAAPGTT